MLLGARAGMSWRACGRGYPDLILDRGSLWAKRCVVAEGRASVVRQKRESGTDRVRRPPVPPLRGGLTPREVERPAATGGEGGTVPQEVAGEADVLPAQG
jgi:hypothetical protein